MTISDYKEVFDLWSNTPNMGLNDIDDTQDGIAKYLLRNPQTCFIAEKDNKIIGAVLSGHDGRRGYISHLAVAKNEQGQGTGTALVNAVVTALANEEIHKVALLVFTTNDKGNNFWEKQGFTTRGDLVYRNKVIK
jgi:ribosomal protein S18 acetylase RimI-like enzyme